MKGLISLFFAIVLVGYGVQASSDAHPVPKQQWSFEGPFGTYDRAALQRGYQVFKEVCSACHGVKLLAYRHLKGIGFSPEEIKALAAGHEYPDISEDGQPIQRKGLPSDRIVSPFPNEKAARAANNGALPVDLSLITKARARGADYVFALLTGYAQSPEEFKVSEGMHYNPFFPGRQIAMIPPLTEGQVTYSDGTKATVAQMSRDVVTFLAWSSEPESERRRQVGIQVLFYLLIFTGLLFISMKKIWKEVH